MNRQTAIEKMEEKLKQAKQSVSERAQVTIRHNFYEFKYCNNEVSVKVHSGSISLDTLKKLTAHGEAFEQFILNDYLALADEA